MELNVWWMLNLKGYFSLSSNDVEASTFCTVICWQLWKNRNAFIFQ